MIVQLAPLIGGVATIVAALIAVIGGARIYRHQRDIDFLQELRKERRRVYANFMSSLIEATQGNGSPHLRARLEAAQIGSEKVIRALAKYNDYADRTGPGTSLPRNAQTMRRLMGDVLVAMREDVFGGTNIPPEEYSNLLPIS